MADIIPGVGPVVGAARRYGAEVRKLARISAAGTPDIRAFGSPSR